MKRLIAIATAAFASLAGIGGYLLVSATPASADTVCFTQQDPPQSSTLKVDDPRTPEESCSIDILN